MRSRSSPRAGGWRALAALALAVGLACQLLSPDRPDAQGYTPLMRAAEAGDVAQIQQLLERGAHPDYQGRLVRRFSILFPFTDTSIEDAPHRGWTPLMVAARAGQAAAIEALLASGAALSLRGSDGTALLMAAEAGQAPAVTALLAGGANPLERDAQGRRPILVALSNGHADAVRAFLAAGTDLGRGEDSFHTENAMIEAVVRGHAALVRELFEAGIVQLLPIAGHEHERVFLSAIGHGHFDVARIPVAAIVDLPRLVGAQRGEELLDALGRGDRDLASALTRAGVDLRSPAGPELLAAAAGAGQPESLRSLLDAGVPIDAPVGHKQRTALMHAAEAGQVAAISLLLERGAQLYARDAAGWTAWMVAERGARTDAARRLAAAGADTTGGAANLALHDAIARGDLRAVEASLRAGADPDAGNASGERPLLVAVHDKRADLAAALIAGGADVNFGRGVRMYTPLLLAITTAQIEMVRALLAAGADPSAPSDQGETPLHLVVTGPEEMLRALVLAGADLCAATKQGETPLARARRIDPGYAHAGGSVPKAALLLAELGAETDPAGCSKHRALETRAESASRADLGRALVAAASIGRIESVRAFLAHHADPNAVGAPGRTALVAAADGGHAEVIRALLAAGADARRPGGDGTTPLLAATRAGRAEAVLALRAAGVNDALEAGGLERALIAAARAGDAARVRALLTAGAQRDWSEDIHRSPDQKPALFAAAEEGHADVVHALLAAGADPNLRRQFFSTHTTPLLTAVLEGRADVVAVLIAAGADVNYQDERGTTPLSVARGQIEVNYQGRRADYARIAALLEQAGARDGVEQARR
jgi:ankyrin repeat protein